MDLEASFHFSDGWFDGFKKRHRISIRRSMNVSQRPASDKESAVRSFHKNIRHIALQGEQTGKVVQPTLILETKLFGFKGVDLD